MLITVTQYSKEEVMPKQTKIVIGSMVTLIALAAVVTGSFTGTAFAMENGTGCSCCKKMDMPMPKK